MITKASCESQQSPHLPLCIPSCHMNGEMAKRYWCLPTNNILAINCTKDSVHTVLLRWGFHKNLFGLKYIIVVFFFSRETNSSWHETKSVINGTWDLFHCITRCPCQLHDINTLKPRQNGHNFSKFSGIWSAKTNSKALIVTETMKDTSLTLQPSLYLLMA